MTHPTNTDSHPRPVKVFYSYSHKDEVLRDELETHLSILKRTRLISGWHDRRISGGTEWKDEISEHLNEADLILLLLSADFIASDYCWDKEMTRAMERHQLGEARVIPIILRDCVWDFAPFSRLQALPRDAKPVAAWGNRDEAFKNITLGIRTVAEELGRRPPKPWRDGPMRHGPPPNAAAPGRKYMSPVRNRRDLLLFGPRLKITFGPPILRAPASVLPEKPETLKRGKFLLTDALLDLGAGRTILTPDAVRKAGLVKIDETSLIRVGGELKADVYAASLQFPHSGLSPIEMIAVVCCELGYPLFHCLLGRDVLSRWVLNYDGPAGEWQLTEKEGGGWVEPPQGIDLWSEK